MDRRNDFLERLDRSSGRIPVAGAQLGPERDRADKGQERQIAVAAIVAVKETSFLLAVEPSSLASRSMTTSLLCLGKQLTPLRKRVPGIASWLALILW